MTRGDTQRKETREKISLVREKTAKIADAVECHTLRDRERKVTMSLDDRERERK